MEIIKKIQAFISYWYLRYLLVTEMYMVEPWEKAVIHVLFATVFGLFWYFNYSFVMHTIAQLRSTQSVFVQRVL
ncbi:serine palmitoyltransferase small subunit A [Hyposmocoma kahamanoa]|uniref:serine palmitoyltransferase small subunit A n=1 Tax=Hyposmocoma kahamanoa TaxID=1477025 RepID=UPI000E6DA267|nr:serine palmitoyltransferase small subunit A [Hyposmocoma kahamanoa]